MRLLIIGGTGFIGAHVTRQLAESGHEVTVFHRGDVPPRDAGVCELRGDRHDLAAHASALERLAPDVVVDMILSSGTQCRALVDTMTGRAGRLVVISSQDVYRATGVFHGSEPGPLEPQPLTEESPLRTRLQTYPPAVVSMLKGVFAWLDDEYDKVSVEKEAQRDPRLPVTILRLPMVYGPGDPLHRMFPIVKRVDDRRPVILLPEPFAAWRGTRGFVEDVAAGIVLAATSTRAAGRIYNLGEAPMSELAWTECVAAAAGFNGWVKVLPDSRIPAHLRVPGNPDQHWAASTARIRHELQFSEHVSADEAVRRTVAWQRAHPPAHVDPAQFDYRAEDLAV
jgi:nucleoside-diphosphate-sugar epimerase